MQREVIAVATESGDNEVDLMLHERSDEVHVARQSIEPRDHERHSPEARLIECRCEPGSQQQRVPPRTGLNILIPRLHGQAFLRGKGLNVVALCREP